MGVTFIGNPFDQETEYDDSDWEMNAVEEWIMPPQEIAFEDGERTPIAVILAAEDDSSESLADDDSDEDYNPDDEDNFNDLYDDVPDFNSYYYAGTDNDSDEDEDIDYVTYSAREENSSDPDKPTATDTVNPGESSDTD